MDRPPARSGDVTALQAVAAPLDLDLLYREARDDVFAYAATLLRDRGAAEDVTAQAFERAYRRRADYDERRGPPRAWLFGIARNAALDELRRRRRTAALPVEAPAEAEDVAERGARRAAVRVALARLTARERELIALKFYAGFDNSEIAAVLGVSTTNAGTLVHRAMTKLREAVDAPH
jgi:RNA polymerase sigma-70 factor (ECF subfamily)